LNNAGTLMSMLLAVLRALVILYVVVLAGL
jgi:hypothetical protein